VSDQSRGELPGLLAWGDELYAATALAERPPRRRRRPLVRRAELAVALVLLLVPGALATRGIWGDLAQRVDPGAPAASPSPARLAEGTSGDVRWRLDGYGAGRGQICTRLEAFRGARSIASGTACARPQARGGLSVMLVPAAGATFVAGTTGASVRSVAIAAGTADRLRVATLALSAETLRRGRLRGAARVYVAVFPRELSRRPGAPRVTGYGAGGRVVVAAADPAGGR
jgi:hypothetical protein